MIAIQHNPLSKLSDSQLINQLDALVQKERETTLEVIRHIIEMDRRKLYLTRGYASLYEYSTQHLGYSESAAYRRIQTARCIRDFPEVYDLLIKNELNLTTVTTLARTLTEENKDSLLAEARCKSKRQVEAIVARISPRSLIQERVRTVYIKSSRETPVTRPASTATGASTTRAQSAGASPEQSRPENWGKFTSAGGGKKLGTCGDTSSHKTVLKKKFKLEFAVNPEVMNMLEDAKAILSTKYPRGISLEQLFEIVLCEYVERHSPRRKDMRRLKRKIKQQDRSKKHSTQDKSDKINSAAATRRQSTKSAEPQATTKAHGGDHPARHIPAAIRDKVFARDHGRCTYIGANGIRCNSTWSLQIDHMKPYARGGDHSIQNLRLLCARHNHHEAERIFGRQFMEHKSSKSKHSRE